MGQPNNSRFRVTAVLVHQGYAKRETHQFDVRIKLMRLLALSALDAPEPD